MANFYTDTPSLRHHLHHPLMRRIVELKERNFRDKDTYDYAPVDFDDAMDSYERVLEMVGEISADVIAPNAEGGAGGIATAMGKNLPAAFWGGGAVRRFE